MRINYYYYYYYYPIFEKLFGVPKVGTGVENAKNFNFYEINSRMDSEPGSIPKQT